MADWRTSVSKVSALSVGSPTVPSVLEGVLNSHDGFERPTACPLKACELVSTRCSANAHRQWCECGADCLLGVIAGRYRTTQAERSGNPPERRDSLLQLMTKKEPLPHTHKLPPERSNQ